MEKTLSVLNSMVQDGVLRQYAIGGAVAAIFYVEPINTNALDVFFRVAGDETDLAILAPLYRYLGDRGYKIQGDTIDIEGWPVQFLPAFNALLDEALNLAREIEFNETVTRIMRAEHLVAIMLQTGRLKDLARVQQFLELEAVDEKKLRDVLTRHGLTTNGAHSSNTGTMKTYPDISRLLKAKIERRRELARLSFEEKIEIVNKWRELSRQIRCIRETDLAATGRGQWTDRDEHRNTLS